MGQKYWVVGIVKTVVCSGKGWKIEVEIAKRVIRRRIGDLGDGLITAITFFVQFKPFASEVLGAIACVRTLASDIAFPWCGRLR